MSGDADVTQSADNRLRVNAEIESLLVQVRLRVPDDSADPRHRLLAALIEVWDDDPPDEMRLDAARTLLTLDQRDVWFLTRNDPVEELDHAASRMLVALGDAITAAGANFSFYSGEPFTPAEDAEVAYAELGEAITHWKHEVLDTRRAQARPPAAIDEV
jgi:hypothetical protein